jgi:hypothetical protein
MKKGLFSVALPVAALLGLSVASAVSVVTTAPAFTLDLREESVLGDWRLAQGETHYVVSDYLYQLGYGYLQADTASLLLGDDALPELEVFDRQMKRSIDLLEESLTYAPGRAGAWTSIAWASLLREDVDLAQRALQTSWQLAPYNFAEAADRVALVSFMEEFYAPITDLGDGALAANAQDFSVLDAYDRSYIQALPEDLEFLFE